MATYSSKLESFFDNNITGGYVQTTSTIGDDDFAARVDAILNTKGYLTSSSHLSWNNIDNKPTIPAAQVNSDWNATSGVSQILNKPTIPSATVVTQTLTEGTKIGEVNGTSLYAPNGSGAISITNTLLSGDRIATITINGQNHDIYAPVNSGGGNGSSSFDPSVLAQVATTGNYNDLINTPVLDVLESDCAITNLSDVAISGQYDDLDDKPALATVATTGNYFDLNNTPIYFFDLTLADEPDLANLFSEDKIISDYDLIEINDGPLNDILTFLIGIYEDNPLSIIKFQSLQGIFTLTTMLTNDEVDNVYYIMLFTPRCSCVYDNTNNTISNLSLRYNLLIIDKTNHKLICKLLPTTIS